VADSMYGLLDWHDGHPSWTPSRIRARLVSAAHFPYRTSRRAPSRMRIALDSAQSLT
jgi:hypothetical protein